MSKKLQAVAFAAIVLAFTATDFSGCGKIRWRRDRWRERRE